MDHLNDVEQVILVQLHQGIRQLLHINTSGTLSLLIGIRLLSRAVLVTRNRARIAKEVDEGSAGGS